MIVYNKLWETMEKKGVSQYKLIKDYGFSTGQLDRLRKKRKCKCVYPELSLQNFRL